MPSEPEAESKPEAPEPEAADAATGDEPPSFEELSTKVKGLVPSAAVGPETWYLIIAAVLIASPNPSRLGDFYAYLTTTATDTRYTAPNNQPLLSIRLRDVLLKLVTLVGAPPVVVAVGALAKAEGKGRADVEAKAAGSQLSEKWKPYDMVDVEQRGQKTINSIYGPLLPKIFAGFGSHREDIVHMEIAHVYGLYLSDHSVLNAIESEVVVLTAILCTGLRSPGLWHIRGLGRLLGARGPDAENQVKDVIRGVKIAAIAAVEFCGEEMEARVRLQEWPNVGDVSRELEGFGEDPFQEEDKKDAQGKAVGEEVGEESETGDTRYHHEGGEEEREWAKEIRPAGKSHLSRDERENS